MCTELVKNVRWGKIVLAAAAYTLISQVVRTVETSLTMSYYQDPLYFGVWSKIMMPGEGPPPVSFFLWSLSFALIIGVVLALFYEWVKELIPKKSTWGRACYFTTVISVLALVLAYFPMYLLINLPLCLTAIWLLSTIIIFYLSALAFVKILK